MCFRMGHGLTHQIPSGVGTDCHAKSGCFSPAELNSAARWMTNPMRPVNSDSTKLDPKITLHTSKCPSISTERRSVATTSRAPPAAKPRKMACPTSPAAPVTKHRVRRDSGVGHQDASSWQCTSRICCLRGRLVRAICSSASGSNPVAKFTFPVALRVPVFPSAFGRRQRRHPSAPSPVRDADHNSNQHCKRKKSRAEHHDRGCETGRQLVDNQEGNGVKPKAGQAPAAPQCSKNAVYGHKGPILGLPAGSGGPEPVPVWYRITPHEVNPWITSLLKTKLALKSN